MSIIVGGGTGFIGQWFSKLAVEKGYKVISVSRTAGENCITWEDVSNNGLPDDCIAVVNMAGEKIMKPFLRWTPEVRTKVRESHINTTQILNKAVCQAKNPPKAFVVLTALACYRPDNEKEYTEDDVGESYNFPSELVKDWEAAAQLSDGVVTRPVVIRTGLTIGKGNGLTHNLHGQFWLGLGGRIGSGDQWFSWVHVEDMAGIILHAIESDAVSGVLNGTAPEPVRSREFTETFASVLGRPHFVPTPEFFLKWVFGTEEACLILEGAKAVPKRTQELGYEFKFPKLRAAFVDIMST